MTPSAATLSLVETRCALCGGDDAALEASGRDFEYATATNEFRFVRCRRCDHVYLNPRPGSGDLGVIYPSNYYAYGGSSNPIVAPLRRRWERGKVRMYRELVGEGPRRILDVGCGNGRFLEILRDAGSPAWRLEGIEIDADAAAACRAKGFRAQVGRVEDFRDAEGFDAVVMLQLIEHVEDPVAICRRVFELLRPGGHFIVETPNLAGLDYGAFRGRWWGHYHFPRHWNLFSTESLQRMLREQGFEIARTEYLISTSAWTISLHNWFLDRGWPDPVVRFFHFQNPLLLGLFVLLDSLRARTGGETSNQRVVARKPGVADSGERAEGARVAASGGGDPGGSAARRRRAQRGAAERR
ncbi:MAG TPA: class I SAM-dependent methyltransferase [Myxococcota bacterium]|nr:class I SAM-dependent methyltransferase [Myxococcota bacterium]